MRHWHLGAFFLSLTLFLPCPSRRRLRTPNPTPGLTRR